MIKTGMAKSSGAQSEFVGAELGDARRGARLVSLAESMSRDPSMSFPKALDEAGLEGAYRLMGNPKVDPDAVLKPHIQRSVERAAADDVVVIAHDSSTMSFGSEGYREGLSGSTGGHQHFLAHVSLAISGDGHVRPHGVLAVSRHVVDQGKSKGKKKARGTKGQLQQRWSMHVDQVHGLGLEPSAIVHVMDREADDYEVFSLIEEHDGGFVIRMQHNRTLVDGDKIRNRLSSVEFRVRRTVALGYRGTIAGPKQKRTHPPRKARKATLDIGATTVVLKRAGSASKSTPSSYQMNVVYVREVNPPDDKSAVEWVLLTNKPVQDDEQLLRVVDWYRARWCIEELFKALKTGCSFEKRQLGSLHALSNALSLLLPMAWKLLLLRSEARHNPDAPAAEVLTSEEISVLRAGGRRPLPDQPTVRDVLLAVAALGGHLKRNGEPGWLTLGRGYEELQALTRGWILARAAGG